MVQKYPFRNYKDLSMTIKNNIFRLPNDIDLIVGIPRSGIIPAYMIALFLNKRVCSLDEFIEGNYENSNGGYRILDEKNKDVKKVLIVDDSICTGRAIKKAKDLLIEKTNYEISYLAIYTNNLNNDLVDYTFEYVPTPRLFQWNYMNLQWTEQACFDIDGVLCVDPTKEENSTEEKYREFLLNAKPLFIPTFTINTLVTSRLEKFRQETEKWLSNNNVKYNQLIMLNMESKEERIKYQAHAKFKAHVYKSLPNTSLFIESEDTQAKTIAALSNKTVVCVSTDEIYYGNQLNSEGEANVTLKLQKRPDEIDKRTVHISDNIKVSVIIPIFNLERYIQQCLNSLRFQTLDEIEIICVDDGSTDDTKNILNENAKYDERIKIIYQENNFAGVARNVGMGIAKGKYLIFLDGDDFFERDLLEKAYNKMEETNSDVCLFKCKTYDEQTQSFGKRELELKKQLLPKDKSVFSYKDIPNEIFNVTTGAPWSKMFRKDFIMELGVEFQANHHYNDFYFVYSAIVSAHRISYIDEALVNYRINRMDSLQNQMKINLLEFTKALLGLKEFLQNNGIYNEVKKSFQNRALTTCLYVLEKQDDFVDFEKVYVALRETYLEKFDLGKDALFDDIDDNNNLVKLIEIHTYNPQDYIYENLCRVKDGAGKNLEKKINDLKWKIRRLEQAIVDKNDYIDVLKEEIKQVPTEEEINKLEYTSYCYNEVLKSKTYRIAMALTYFFRVLKRKK